MSRLYTDANDIQQAAIFKQSTPGNYPPRNGLGRFDGYLEANRICRDERELRWHIEDLATHFLPKTDPLLQRKEELLEELYRIACQCKNLQECNKGIISYLQKKQEGE